MTPERTHWIPKRNILCPRSKKPLAALLPDMIRLVRHFGRGADLSHLVLPNRVTTEGQVVDSAATLLTSAAALAGVVGVILLTGWALRHTSMRKPTSSERLLIVKDTIALDARRRLYLVQHGDRAVLLLTGGTNDVVVGWLDGLKSP